MRKHARKGISLVLVIALLAALWPSVLSATPHDVEPPPDVEFSLIANQEKISPGDTVNLTVDFNLLSGYVSGYTKTRVVVVLPTGMTYYSSVIYVGGAPAAITTVPITTPRGTTVTADFDNVEGTPGPAKLAISARISSTWGGTDLEVTAELYMQPMYYEMPDYPKYVKSLVLHYYSYEPIAPGFARVTFNPNGGTRQGGGNWFKMYA